MISAKGKGRCAVGACILPTWHSVGGWTNVLRPQGSPCRAHRYTAYITGTLNKQFAASGRGMGRSNAPSRRLAPVMIRQALAETIPPSNAGQREHIENKLRESSPISHPVHAGDIAISTTLQPVRPTLPAAGYIGGKRNLAGRLVKHIATIPHTTYAEVFVGMGGVFLRRTARPKVEVINDWSGDVSTFFRVLQRHYVAFVDMMRHQITSRAEFEKLAAMPPESLTDLERSARFLYLQRLSFGGKVVSRSFGVDPANTARFDITKIVPMLEAIHERMAGVTVERLPWAEFLTRYDREATLFYLDPPYYSNEGDYGRDMFSRDDFALMAERLRGLKGRFILSLNDRPEVREIFAAFNIEAVETTYSVGGGSKAQKAGEVIISNA